MSAVSKNKQLKIINIQKRHMAGWAAPVVNSQLLGWSASADPSSATEQAASGLTSLNSSSQILEEILLNYETGKRLLNKNDTGSLVCPKPYH